jgi:hypothetical protein
MALALLLAMSAVGWTPPAGGSVATIAFPTIGRTSCVGTAPGHAEGTLRLRCTPAGDASALTVAFFHGDRGFNGYVRLKEIRTRGLPSPGLLAVAVTTGGSDASFETALIAEVDGRLVDLWPRHWLTNILDDICVGELGPGKPVGVAGFAYIWGNGKDEWHYAPHRYRMTLYEWRDSTLSFSGAEVSPRRAPSWSDAAQALGFRCEGRLHAFGELDAFRVTGALGT